MNRDLFMPKAPRISRIARRKSGFDILFLIGIFVAVLAVFFIVAVNVHNNASESFAYSRSEQTARRFYAHVNKSLVLVQKAAHSSALRSWFADEENPEKRAIAYQEMSDYFKVLPEPHLYFGIDKSLNVFSFHSGMGIDKFEPYKKLVEGDPDDAWYFNGVDSDREYLFNFDQDDDSRLWKLWLNHKVMVDSKTAGIFCVALKIDNLRDELFADYGNGRESGFIIDEKGVVLMRANSTQYYNSEVKTRIWDMFNDSRLKAMVKESLAGGDSGSPQTVVTRSSIMPFRYNAITRIPETGWSVVVVFNSDYLTGLAGMMNFLPLPLVLLFALVLFAVVSNTYASYLVFSPMAKLTRSIAEAESDSLKIYGYKRPDEIGELARAIRESRSRLNATYMILREANRDKEAQERLLYAVNKTAVLLTSSDDEENFRQAIIETMKAIGESLDLDRLCLWRTEMINDASYFVPQYEWLAESFSDQQSIMGTAELGTFEYPQWTEKFMRGECVNGPVRNLTDREKDLFSYNSLKSVLLLPIHLHDIFWGFITFGDCRNERYFGDEEINILRSASLMMVSAINRTIQANKLRGAHERVLTMLNATPVCVSLWSRNKILIDCNDVAVKMFKMKNKQEYIERYGETSPEFQPNGQRSIDLGGYCLHKAFADGQFISHWTYQLLDGTPIPSEVTMVRVPYGDDFAVASYTRDLRDQNRMMEQIEHRDYLLHTVNRVAAVLLRSDTDHFEADLLACMGMLAKAVSADRVYLWKNFTQDGKLYSTQIHEWSGGAEPQQGKEFTVKHVFGEHEGIDEKLASDVSINAIVRELPPSERDFFGAQGIQSILLLPIFLKDTFWGFVGFDDCHRERFFSANEESILRSGGLLMANALLRNEMTWDMRSSAEQLEEALERAQDANAAKTNFLANMSHEMRTPLNAVIGLSELALTSQRLEEETHSNLVKIHNAGATLLSTVNDILDISKIEAGKLELVPVEYELPSVINDTVTQAAVRMEDKPLQFALDIEENLPMRLYGDELRVKEIFNNLLSNAFKYTREGTIELGIRCVRDGDNMWLSGWVKDSGIGIREEDIKKLFSDYIQVDKQANRKIEGTGLGLAITQRLVALMDGTIDLQSEYGRGSVFSVKLKQKYVSDETIGPDMVQNLKNFRYTERKRRQNLRFGYLNMSYARILVVDDIITNLDVARGMLKPYGLQVDCVTGGQEAIDAIRDEKVRYNAIFMDHMMPGMDGIEAARVIREEIGSEYAKTIPIIALTANAIIGSEEKFLDAGFQAFVSKPIELSSLDNTLREWVRDAEQEKLLEEKPANNPAQGAQGGEEADRRRPADRRSGIDRRIFGANVAGIDLARGMERFGNNRETYLDVMHSFAVNTRPLLERLKDFESMSNDDYVIVTHGIKSSSRGIGAFPLGDRAEALEKAGKKGNTAFVRANNGDFTAALEELINGIEDALRGQRRDNPKPKKDSPDTKSLEKLLIACKNYDMDEADAAITEIEKWDYESDGGLAAWLKENVDLMNFSDLEKKLSVLLNGSEE